MKPDLYPIPGPWKGQLAIVARPRGGDWLEDEAAAWRSAGVDVVVSLLEPDEAADLGLANESGTAAVQGVRLISFPIPDRDIPASNDDALVLLNEVKALLEQGRTVAVHCRQSVGRSGLIAIGALALAGVSLDKAIATVGTARGQTVPETAEQLRWLRELRF